MPHQVKLPRPHPGHLKVISEAKRFNFLCAGRRWRKSCLLMSLGVRAALKGKPVFVGAPTFDQVRIVWDYTRRAARGIANFNQGRLEATFPNGGKIIYRSLDDPDNARGHTATLVLLDEAPLIKAEAWNQVVMPMLLDTGGDAWLVGTPYGRNWYFAEHKRKAENRMSWQIPTVGCKIVDDVLVEVDNKYSNPTLNFNDIEAYFNSVPQATFRTEILAEFVEDNTSVFRNIRECATADAYTERRRSGSRYVIGVDLAKHIDFSVLTVLDIINQQVVHIDRFNQLDYTTQENRLVALYEKFNPERVLIEVNSAGEPFCEQLESRGLPIVRFLTTNASKKQIIDALALAFERREIQIPNNTILIDELLSFQSKRLPSGRLSYAAPAGLHDDCVMSLAIAWSGRQSNKLEYGVLMV